MKRWHFEVEAKIGHLCFDVERDEVTASGALVLYDLRTDGTEALVFAFAPGEWRYVHSADALAGGATSHVAYWQEPDQPESPKEGKK